MFSRKKPESIESDLMESDLMESDLMESDLMNFLENCKDGAGTYVNMGRNGFGFKYTIVPNSTVKSPLQSPLLDSSEQSPLPYSSEQSPLPYSSEQSPLPYSSEQSPYQYTRLCDTVYHTSHDNKTIFIKFVPLDKYKTKYLHKKDTFDFDSMLKEEFIAECEIQVEAFKKTNNNLNSFVLPIYGTTIIEVEKPVIHTVIESLRRMTKKLGMSKIATGMSEILKSQKKTDLFKLLEKKSNDDEHEFFKYIKGHLVSANNYRQLGIIVMPFMDAKLGRNVLGHLFKPNGMFNTDKITTPVSVQVDGKEEVQRHLFDSVEINILVQIIYCMLKLYELNIFHGDLHMNNVFVEGGEENGIPPRVSIFDFGAATKGHVIPGINKLEDTLADEKSFKEALYTIITTKGRTDYAPIDRLNWLPYLLFTPNTNDTRRQSGMEIEPEHLFKGKTIGNMIDHNVKFLFERVKAFQQEQKEFEVNNIDDVPRGLLKEIWRHNSSENLRTTLRGGSIKMNTMIRNLYNGEESLRRLKEPKRKLRKTKTKRKIKRKTKRKNK
jgi:hypothetical protein